MFGLSFDFLLGLLSGMFLGMFLGNKSFRNSLMRMMNMALGKKPKKTEKQDIAKTAEMTDDKGIHIHIHK